MSHFEGTGVQSLDNIDCKAPVAPFVISGAFEVFKTTPTLQIVLKIKTKMTNATEKKVKDEKTKEEKINEIMADGATVVKMEVDYR